MSFAVSGELYARDSRASLGSHEADDALLSVQ
jgi:hypothetical protein